MKRLACHYCGMPAVRVEYDHFPVPQDAGGKEVVPACVNCHDLKDRTSLRDSPWSDGMLVSGLGELIGCDPTLVGMPVWPRDFDILTLLGDAIGRWEELSVTARLTYGKIRATEERTARAPVG